MSGFTPGPWAEPDEDVEGGVPVLVIETDQPTGPRLFRICAVESRYHQRNDEFHITDEVRANANLIRAAPDLYTALDMQVRNCPVCKGDGVAEDVMDLLMNKPKPWQKKDCERCSSSRAALAKARGK